MAINQPFFPTYGAGQNLSATSTSQTTTFRKGNKQLRLVNVGPNNAYIRVAAAANIAAASIADYKVPVTTGTHFAFVISIPEDADSISYIAPAGTATVHIQPGEGF